MFFIPSAFTLQSVVLYNENNIGGNVNEKLYMVSLFHITYSVKNNNN